jgi:hypothetical protein
VAVVFSVTGSAAATWSHHTAVGDVVVTLVESACLIGRTAALLAAPLSRFLSLRQWHRAAQAIHRRRR